MSKMPDEITLTESLDQWFSIDGPQAHFEVDYKTIFGKLWNW